MFCRLILLFTLVVVGLCPARLVGCAHTRSRVFVSYARSCPDPVVATYSVFESQLIASPVGVGTLVMVAMTDRFTKSTSVSELSVAFAV